VIDVVIVGGGPAGMSAALVLGRARRRVLVIDAERPANAVSEEVGGLLGHGGVAPGGLREAGRAQLAEHPDVEVRRGAVAAAEADGGVVVVTPQDGPPVRARTLLLAHGLSYEPPAVKGAAALWGRSVLHCPFCDGWEMRDRPLAVLGAGPQAARRALTVAGWSRDVVLCTDGDARIGPERAALARMGVRVREEPVRELAARDGRLDRIEFAGGAPEPREALFVSPRIRQPNDLARRLGCVVRSDGTILVDADGRTAVPGVYAAGDTASSAVRSVAIAIGSGARSAHAIVLDLAQEAA
jgi:thioredoxin reductase